MAEQLSLLEWRPPAEIVSFPLHRAHGATAGAARAIMDLETAKRTGKLNSIRAQTRKRMETLFGAERAEKIADDLVKAIRLQIMYREVSRTSVHPERTQGEAMIFTLTGQPLESIQQDTGASKAGALGQGTKFLAGVGRAHVEYDAAREGGLA